MANNPPKKVVVYIIVTLLIGLWSFLVFMMLRGWPPDETFLFKKFKLNYEQQLMLLVIFSGALGAFIHATTSFTVRFANGSFGTSWIPWYVMRPFLGATLALTFYFLLRGGMINFDTTQQQRASMDSVTNIFRDTVSTSTIKSTVKSTAASLKGFEKVGEEKIPPIKEELPINPFGITAMSMLAGLFSKQAIDKLKEIFDNLFLKKEDAEKNNSSTANSNNNNLPPPDETGEDEEAVG